VPLRQGEEFEILSESTEAHDRGDKFQYYRDCPTLEEYVLVATKRQAVEVYRRAGGHWGTFETYAPIDTIELASIKVLISVAALYKRTGVPETQPLAGR
jgi:Uma2 family endonuclease